MLFYIAHQRQKPLMCVCLIIMLYCWLLILRLELVTVKR